MLRVKFRELEHYEVILGGAVVAACWARDVAATIVAALNASSSPPPAAVRVEPGGCDRLGCGLTVGKHEHRLEGR